MGIFCLGASVQANDEVAADNGLSQLFKQLEIVQGTANFIQKKHFSFLATPIISQGTLKINKGNVIWQVEKPVFSKLMIIKDQVWQLASQKNELPARYLPMVSHASIETLIRAIFTSEVNPSQWQITIKDPQCLQLTPNDSLLSQAINNLSICLTQNEKQRHVTIKDAQNNLTEIEINITAYTLSDDDLREFNFKQ